MRSPKATSLDGSACPRVTVLSHGAVWAPEQQKSEDSGNSSKWASRVTAGRRNEAAADLATATSARS